jgi:hypothetical protein
MLPIAAGPRAVEMHLSLLSKVALNALFHLSANSACQTLKPSALYGKVDNSGWPGRTNSLTRGTLRMRVDRRHRSTRRSRHLGDNDAPLHVPHPRDGRTISSGSADEQTRKNQLKTHSGTGEKYVRTEREKMLAGRRETERYKKYPLKIRSHRSGTGSRPRSRIAYSGHGADPCDPKASSFRVFW